MKGDKNGSLEDMKKALEFVRMERKKLMGPILTLRICIKIGLYKNILSDQLIQAVDKLFSICCVIC